MINRKDNFKLGISRNWKFPGQTRLAKWLKPSNESSQKLRNGIIWIEDENISIYTTADNYIENSILTTGTYESEIAKIINFSLVPGDVCLDIGCNIGLQSLRMSKMVGLNGKVLSFEPLAYLRDKSFKNFSLNRTDNIQLLPYALSDIDDIFEIDIDEHIYNQGTFNLLQKPTGGSRQHITVKVGDTLSEISSLTQLALIKIDVEGFEYNVLKGLVATLKKFKPRIIMEFDKNYWIRNNQDVKHCYEFLSKMNYHFYQINSIGCELVARPENITDGNLLIICNG